MLTRPMRCLWTGIAFALVFSVAAAAHGQAVEESAPTDTIGVAPAPPVRTGEAYSTEGRLRLQFEGAVGVGIDSSTVGVTTGGEDVKISGGGGFGLGVTLGYGLSKNFDLDGTFGLQGSGLQPAVDNADGTFGRAFLLATLKYKVPVRENLQWKFGLGGGLYKGELDIDIDPGVPGAGHSEIDYKRVAGVHATGELEIMLREQLSLSIGLKYYHVTYKADTYTFNGSPQPISNLKEEFRNFKGDGVDVTVGVGVLF